MASVGIHSEGPSAGSWPKGHTQQLVVRGLDDKGEEVREQIRGVISRREVVQGRLNDLLRPFRAARIVPALRETGGSVKDLITEVRKVLPPESTATPHLQQELDEALGLEDEGHMLGRLLDLFLFGEVRGAVEQVLGVKVSNGNGG